MEIGSKVKVTDVGNYKKEYAELVPFEATLINIDLPCYWVESNVTGRLYEVYSDSIEAIN